MPAAGQEGSHASLLPLQRGALERPPRRRLGGVGPVAARKDRYPGAQLARSGAPDHKTREAGQRRDIAIVALWALETICALASLTTG